MAFQQDSSLSALDQLRSYVEDDAAQVEIVLQEQMKSQAVLIPKLSNHIIEAGGKRIRPLLLLTAAKSYGYTGVNAHQMAAAVEFIHTATLLHDDVVDKSEQRRHRATANALWGNKASILVGDFLFSRAFQLMVNSNSLKALEILSSASAIIAEGEVLQLVITGNLNTTIDGYINVIRAKTAALFAAACETGAVLAAENGNAANQELMQHYGHILGIIFQIRDDMRDYTVVPGKESGNDFLEQKVTAPVLYAYQKSSTEEKEFWQRTIGNGKFEADDFQKAQTLIQKYNAIEDCRTLARSYYEQLNKTQIAAPLLAVLDDALSF